MFTWAAGLPISPYWHLIGIVLLLFLAGKFGLHNWIKDRFGNKGGDEVTADPGRLRLSMPSLTLIGTWLAVERGLAQIEEAAAMQREMAGPSVPAEKKSVRPI